MPRRAGIQTQSITSLGTSLGEGLVSLFFLLALLNPLPVIADNDKNTNEQWKQYKNEDGIIGYEHNVQRSKYLETRAETVIDAPIEVLLEVLKDIPSYPQWMYQCKTAVPLKQEGELKSVLYFAQGVPLGSPDRDAVIEATIVEDLDKGAYVTTLLSIDHHPYQHPNKEGSKKKRQRMIEFCGKWDIRMIDRNQTKVIYTAFTNPGGFAPRFIVNRVIRNVSFRSLKGMISKVKEKKYIEAGEKSLTKKKIEAAINNGSLVFAPSTQKTEVSMPQ